MNFGVLMRLSTSAELLRAQPRQASVVLQGQINLSTVYNTIWTRHETCPGIADSDAAAHYRAYCKPLALLSARRHT
jgi:hypothetical protein